MLESRAERPVQGTAPPQKEHATLFERRNAVAAELPVASEAVQRRPNTVRLRLLINAHSELASHKRWAARFKNLRQKT